MRRWSVLRSVLRSVWRDGWSRRRPVRAGLVGVTAAVLVVTVAPGGTPSGATASAATADGWSPPRLERLVSGPSRPGIGAWGLAHNPVTDEFVVGDYTSNQVRRYSRDGVHLGDFSNPSGSTDGVPSAIAVDPRDGSTYVAITGDNHVSRDVRKYDRDGEFLWDADVPGPVTWLTIDDDGYLWAPAAFRGHEIRRYRIDDANRRLVEVDEFGRDGTGPGRNNWLTGIDVAANGDVFVADAGNGVVHVYRRDGSWKLDIGDRQRFPGDIRGVLVDDARSRVYVADAWDGRIKAFALDGTFLFEFSGLGDGDGRFLDGARQLAMTPDGHLWAADYGGQRVLEFTADGLALSTFPDPPTPPDPAGAAGPLGVAVDPATDDVLVADYWNQRVQRFAPDGTLLEAFGRRGSLPPDGMNYPRSVAVDPDTGHVWVGNYEGNPFLVEYDADFAFVRKVVTPRFINDIEIVDGLVYLAMRRPDGGAVRVHDAATGELVDACCSSLGNLRGIAVDPDTGYLWLTSHSRAEVYVVEPDGDRVRTLRVDGRGWGVAIVGDVVYVADNRAHRVIAFDRTDYDRLGTFGTGGTGPGQLRGPAGITADAEGDLYVVEEGNGRVSVFTSDPPSPAESAAPTVAFDPATPQVVDRPPLVLSGTARDVSGVAQVEVEVRDDATGRWWNARSAAWSWRTWSQAVLRGPTTDATWAFTLVPGRPGGTYTVRVRATDLHGNVAAPVQRTFRVREAGDDPPDPPDDPPVPPVDAAPPDTTLTRPSGPGQTLPADAQGVVALAGAATDDTAVARVLVSVQDQATGRWWDAATGAWGPWKANDADLDAMGATDTAWTATFTGASGGRYWISARAVDAVDERDPSPAGWMIVVGAG